MADPQKVKVFDGTDWVDLKADDPNLPISSTDGTVTLDSPSANTFTVSTGTQGIVSCSDRFLVDAAPASGIPYDASGSSAVSVRGIHTISGTNVKRCHSFDGTMNVQGSVQDLSIYNARSVNVMAGGSITNIYSGFKVDNLTAYGIITAGYYSEVASNGSDERYQFYGKGTAPSYFGGDIQTDKITSKSGASNDVSISLGSDLRVYASADRNEVFTVTQTGRAGVNTPFPLGELHVSGEEASIVLQKEGKSAWYQQILNDDMIFGTLDNYGTVPPTVNSFLKISDSGDVQASAGYVPETDDSLVTKGWVTNTDGGIGTLPISSTDGKVTLEQHATVKDRLDVRIDGKVVQSIVPEQVVSWGQFNAGAAGGFGATNPAYTFSGAEDTGFYLTTPAGGKAVNISVGGQEWVVVNAAGNVGIGSQPHTSNRLRVEALDDTLYADALAAGSGSSGTSQIFLRNSSNTPGTFSAIRFTDAGGRAGLLNFVYDSTNANQGGSWHFQTRQGNSVYKDVLIIENIQDGGNVIVNEGQLQTDTITTKDDATTDGKINLSGTGVELYSNYNNYDTSFKLAGNSLQYSIGANASDNKVFLPNPAYIEDVDARPEDYDPNTPKRVQHLQQYYYGLGWTSGTVQNAGAGGTTFDYQVGSLITMARKQNSLICYNTEKTESAAFAAVCDDTNKYLRLSIDGNARVTISEDDIQAFAGYVPQTDQSLVTKGWVTTNGASGNLPISSTDGTVKLDSPSANAFTVSTGTNETSLSVNGRNVGINRQYTRSHGVSQHAVADRNNYVGWSQQIEVPAAIDPDASGNRQLYGQRVTPTNIVPTDVDLRLYDNGQIQTSNGVKSVSVFMVNDDGTQAVSMKGFVGTVQERGLLERYNIDITGNAPSRFAGQVQTNTITTKDAASGDASIGLSSSFAVDTGGSRRLTIRPNGTAGLNMNPADTMGLRVQYYVSGTEVTAGVVQQLTTNIPDGTSVNNLYHTQVGTTGTGTVLNKATAHYVSDSALPMDAPVRVGLELILNDQGNDGTYAIYSSGDAPSRFAGPISYTTSDLITDDNHLVTKAYVDSSAGSAGLVPMGTPSDDTTPDSPNGSTLHDDLYLYVKGSTSWKKTALYPLDSSGGGSEFPLPQPGDDSGIAWETESVNLAFSQPGYGECGAAVGVAGNAFFAGNAWSVDGSQWFRVQWNGNTSASYGVCDATSRTPAYGNGLYTGRYGYSYDGQSWTTYPNGDVGDETRECFFFQNKHYSMGGSRFFDGQLKANTNPNILGNIKNSAFVVPSNEGPSQTCLAINYSPPSGTNSLTLTDEAKRNVLLKFSGDMSTTGTWSQLQVEGSAIQTCYGLAHNDLDDKYCFITNNTSYVQKTAGNFTSSGWTKTTLPTTGEWAGLVHDGTHYVAVGIASGANISIYSEDGIAWSQSTTLSNPGVNTIAGFNGRVLAAGNLTNSDLAQILVTGNPTVTFTTKNIPLDHPVDVADSYMAQQYQMKETQADANELFTEEIQRRSPVMTLTQVEYDAIPADEIDDNTLYLITS